MEAKLIDVGRQHLELAPTAAALGALQTPAAPPAYDNSALPSDFPKSLSSSFAERTEADAPDDDADTFDLTAALEADAAEKKNQKEKNVVQPLQFYP